MKIRNAKPAAAIFLILTLVGLSGCTPNYTATDLHGKRQITELDADMPELSPAIIQAGEELALSTIYEFNTDGSSVETSNYYPEGILGQWTFNQDSMLLYITSTDEAIPCIGNYSVEFLIKRVIKMTQDYQELGQLSMTLTKRKN